MMYKAIGAVSSLLLVCACVLAIAADPPQAKLGDKPKKKEKKAKAPAGYEDAPQAGAPPAPNVVRAPIRAMQAVAVEDVPADFEQLLALNVDANVARREKQFLPQFTPLLTAELSFINRVCDLDLQQRRKIKAASDLCLKGAVRKYAMTQLGVMMRGGVNRGNQTMPDPTELLHEALAKVLGETLQAEQQTAYDREMAKRKAYRQHVAVDNVVAMIDERLVLATDQREKLTQSLVENWQPHWVQSIEMMNNNTQYLPSIPDQFVVPALNESQRKVWQAAQKQNYLVTGGFPWGQQGGAVDDFPLVENDVDAEGAAAN